MKREYFQALKILEMDSSCLPETPTVSQAIIFCPEEDMLAESLTGKLPFHLSTPRCGHA
jgi:hypothetical protein